MKRVNIILTALLLSLCAAQLQAQRDGTTWHSMSELPYKPWAAFAGDTARYLEFNYNIRSMQYAGWTVGEFLDELELPVIGIVNRTSSVCTGNSRPPLLVGLTFGIHQKGDVHSPLRDYYINVGFENPPSSADFRKISPVGCTAITPEVYNFIRNLRISGVSTNEFILRDPELIERRRREFEEIRRRAPYLREAAERRRQEWVEREREREQNRGR